MGFGLGKYVWEKRLIVCVVYVDSFSEISEISLKNVAVSVLQCICTTLTLTKTHREKDTCELHRMGACCLEQILEATLHNTTVARPLTSHLPNHPSKSNKTWWAFLKQQGQTQERRFLLDSFTWTNQCWLTNKDLLTSALCGYWLRSRRRYQEWEMIAKDCERKSGNSVLSNYIYIYIYIYIRLICSHFHW